MQLRDLLDKKSKLLLLFTKPHMLIKLLSIEEIWKFFLSKILNNQASFFLYLLFSLRNTSLLLFHKLFRLHYSTRVSVLYLFFKKYFHFLCWKQYSLNCFFFIFRCTECRKSLIKKGRCFHLHKTYTKDLKK